MTVRVKICGLTDLESVNTSVKWGADYLGFVFYKNSPRYISVDNAVELFSSIPSHISKVGLFVNPDNDILESVTNKIKLDYVQLHGNESPDMVYGIRSKHNIPIIKAIGVADRTDVLRAKSYFDCADIILFDAKPSEKSSLPGGNARSFSWDIVADYSENIRWFLAGGLNPSNVSTAITVSGAAAVDVSSGVEKELGKKDSKLIRAFIRSAKDIL